MKATKLNALDVKEFEIVDNSRVAIFVHWSKNDAISNHDANLINTLALEFDQVLVVCNLNKLRNKCKNLDFQFQKNVHFSFRSNLGYDFGAYKAGLNFLRPLAPSIAEILLINNSIYKLQHSLSPLMEKVRASNFDVTAITNSREHQLHLQSYFLHLKKSVVDTTDFWDWFEHLHLNDDKKVTVNRLEIPFAQNIESFGLSSGALWDFDELSDFYFSSSASSLLLDFRKEWGWFIGSREILSGKTVNPTHYMWPHLLELGCPFLKKDLFRNRDLYLGIDNWERFVSSPQMHALVKESI